MPIKIVYNFSFVGDSAKYLNRFSFCLHFEMQKSKLFIKYFLMMVTNTEPRVSSISMYDQQSSYVFLEASKT